MEMVVGLIVGLILVTSIYVLKSENFTKTQKIILLICALFAPLQWIGIFIFLSYNKTNSAPKNAVENKVIDHKAQFESTIESLKNLKEKGVLSADEFEQKLHKIELEQLDQDIKKTVEYKQLRKLYDLEILTQEEFESKIFFLKREYEKKRNGVMEVKSNVSQLTEGSNDYDIEVKHESTNFDNKLNRFVGKFIVYEIKESYSELNGFEIYKSFNDERFFIKEGTNIHYFPTIEDLINEKFNLKVKVRI